MATCGTARVQQPVSADNMPAPKGSETTKQTLRSYSGKGIAPWSSDVDRHLTRSTYHVFTMRFAHDLPGRIAVGQPFASPVTVLFGRSEEAIPLQGDIWLFASLTDADSDTAAGDNALQGQRADSLHPTPNEQSGDIGDAAYASFEGLMISRPGRYRLRITAVDMGA